MRGDNYDGFHQDLATGEGMREHPETDSDPVPMAEVPEEESAANP